MPPNDERKQPKGAALDLSDEDLDTMAEIAEADIVRAQQRWQRSVDRRYRNLLLAEEDIDDDLPAS